ITTLLLVAVAGETQFALLVITHQTESLLASVVVVYEPVLPDCSTPSLYHWYVGELPPLFGDAVNVTEVPAQTVVSVVLMVTDGTTVVTMVITTLLLVAVDVERQFALDVNTHQTESLPASALFV